ncbi:MAG: helix-turn-helix domain-containing protein [Defluviitaleaceae bacterium]|nr:helix-turn-helix domain-containing protein [Defluviitaleaceae bacterium]
MLSNQILQNCIDGTKSITRREISVIEREGKVIASTNDTEINSVIDIIENFIASPAESQLVQGSHFFKVFDNGVAEYVVCISGEDDETYRIGKMTAFQIQHLIIAYKERYDKDNFLKNLLLDNLLLVDIYSRAKKLDIENAVRRIVYLIEVEVDKDLSILEVVRNIFPEKLKDFVTAVDERSVILVKELSDSDDLESINRIAQLIFESLTAEPLQNIRVSIGTTVNDLKNVSQSYKESKMALEVGRIFEPERFIVNYEELGIGRLIYQLPVNLCRMFINEVLHGTSMDQFDTEILVTVNKFFENNLNVSETSRQLYIHRNTLVYRLDKLQKQTGLDLRNFDDAIVFKITLMVSKYLEHIETSLYK